MRGIILTEESSTVADSMDVRADDFFEGTFTTIATLIDELAPLVDVETLIVSEKYGFLRGSDVVEDASLQGYQTTEVVEVFHDEVSTADAVGVFLTNDVFEEIIVANWRQLVAAAQPGSVWCLGASRGALSQVKVAPLREKGCTVVLYGRKGVARIGSDTRIEFVGAVRDVVDSD